MYSDIIDINNPKGVLILEFYKFYNTCKENDKNNRLLKLL